MAITLSEVVVPVTTDLRADNANNNFNIIKGLENIAVKDETMATGVNTTAGDWLVKGASGVLNFNATSTPVANTYPVWVGNDEYDSIATGKVTIIVSGGFIYRTVKFVAGTYTEGQNLTVDSTGLRAAVSAEPVLARVYTAPDANGVMEVLVLQR